MIKLVASDLDGTLVPDSTDQINPEIYDLVMKLKKKGIRFVAASGRQYKSIRRLFAPVADDIFYIAESGGVLRDAKEMYFADAIPKERIRELVDDIRRIEDTDIMLCGVDNGYCDSPDSYLYHWMTESYQYDMIAVSNLPEDIKEPVVKVSMFHPKCAEEAAARAFTPKWQKTMQVSCSGVNWMDVMNASTHKGHALGCLQERLGIAPEETMVFGDNTNDLTMLSQAYHSYAIGNAREEVKQCARFQADTCANDGVIKVLRTLL
ncbi:MAG: HAD family hydrolase [Clostridiales bacterium]|nr:HAD family hydrolase [Clostridiales bacterium]